MPKDNGPANGKQMQLERRSGTVERLGYVEGLFNELYKYKLQRILLEVTRPHQKGLAQLGIAEATVQAIRGYIYTQLR